MTETYIVIESLDALNFVPEMTAKTELALTRALNRTAERSRTRMDKTIRSQIAFPASYLRPSSKRLWVKKRATQNSFEAIIEGRGRATSLARFSRQKPLGAGRRHRGGVVNVTVKPGQRRSIDRAFIISLKHGNKGLAVRTDGSKPRGSYKPKKIGKNLWLLYGPSVDQALMSASTGGGVIEEMTPDVLDMLETEYLRQLDLLGEI